MNNNMIKTALLLLTSAAITSCADNDIAPFSVSKPESIVRWEYLNSYGPLKGYVDRSANPGFKLGLALEANDFNSYGVPYRIACSNFDEVTAGNAMKYASCVADDGTMDFSTVKSFVENARLAGITIYGHTLAWHSQQNNKYLNSLIADRGLEVDPGTAEEVVDKTFDYSDYTKYPYFVMGYEPEMKDGCMVSTNPSGEWIQYFVGEGVPTNSGKDYTVTAKIKASAAGSLDVVMGDWSNSVKTKLSFTDEWQEVSVNVFSVPASTSHIIFQPGTFNGDIYIEWLKVSHKETPSVTIDVPVFTLDASDGNPLGGWNNSGLAWNNTVQNGVYAIELPGSANVWDIQLNIENNYTNGETYNLKFKVKGSTNGKIQAGFQNPDGYKGCGDFPEATVSTEWKQYEGKCICNGDGARRLLFNVGTYKGTLYLDDIALSYEKKSNTIPLTDKEKKDTLTWAMDNWINGMMEATGGYVTAWDLVNEALSGTDKDGDGYYDLQSATRGTVSETDAASNFYWQDYLGDIDYVRIAEAKARTHFAGNGGNPADLKLFINDYNLESDWDDNKKLKSLIHWINRWESDGVTKIDGIGTQMHITCYENETTQQSKKEHIVNMFKLLAGSGKLVKISELDMGFVDEYGNDVKTEDLTDGQHKAMGELYTFVVQKYFELIPAAQRYGITQWCATDSPVGSGWRAGQPVGLWTIDYVRKPAYGGFADGLSGNMQP